MRPWEALLAERLVHCVCARVLDFWTEVRLLQWDKLAILLSFSGVGAPLRAALDDMCWNWRSISVVMNFHGHPKRCSGVTGWNFSPQQMIILESELQFVLIMVSLFELHASFLVHHKVLSSQNLVPFHLSLRLSLNNWWSGWSPEWCSDMWSTLNGSYLNVSHGFLYALHCSDTQRSEYSMEC